MSFVTTNKRIACSPFPTNQAQMTRVGRVAMLEHTQGLAELEVLFASDTGFQPGDKVYVQGSTAAHPFSKEVLKRGDVSYILIPVDFVLAFDKRQS